MVALAAKKVDGAILAPDTSGTASAAAAPLSSTPWPSPKHPVNPVTERKSDKGKAEGSEQQSLQSDPAAGKGGDGHLSTPGK